MKYFYLKVRKLLKNNMNSMKSILSSLKLCWTSQLTLLYFSAQVLLGSSESIRDGKDSMILVY